MGDESAQFSSDLERRMRSAGLPDVRPLSSTYDEEHFGSGEATFEVDLLLIRIVRDRDQESLALAFVDAPTLFHAFEDVEICMGWRRIEDVISASHPQGLDASLRKFADHYAELRRAFSGEQAPFTRARIRDTEKKRRRAYIDRLKAGR